MINSLGRKALISGGLFIQIVCFLGLMSGTVFSISWLIVASFCFFMFGFSFSVGGTIYVYTSEIIPAKVLMLPYLMQAILTVLIGSFTLKLINLVGLYALYATFGGAALIGWLLFEGFGIETKGKENSQIIKEFKKKRFMR